MHKLLVPILLTLAAVCRLYGATESYPVSGRVIDRLTRQPVPFAAVVISGQPGKGAMADSAGKFTIAQVKPGIYRLSASMLGYRSALTPEYIVSAGTPFIEIELEKEAQGIETVTVMPFPVRRTAESPVSVRTIGLREIEKSPGSNRDIARIVRSYPGVSFSPVGYRNDLIVRGGGPSENRFFMDGIEIPNINHFATQGASGGPVSLVNSDLIREIDFYTGAFPADRAGALSSVLDFRLRDGDPDRQRFRATLGASEVGLSGSGHIGEKATFLFSARQSYLQMLFKLLGLPFLPNYIDAQAKVRIRFSQRDELTVLALAGIDNMRLNTDEKGEETEYLLSYLPRLRQETFTVGASYRHYAGRHAQTVTLSHSYLNNRNTKYLGNDESSEDNLTLRLRAVEQKTSLRAENRSHLGRWTLREGVELSYSHYTNRTFRRFFAEQAGTLNYRTQLGLTGWGAFVAADYASADDRLTVSAGIRADGSDFSAETARPWHQLSPRASVRYALSERWTVAASAGLYYQLPPFTALGFENGQGERVNRGLKYMRVAETSAGFDWRLRDRLTVSIEGFHKFYTGVPLSLADSIPLTCQGNDYGTVGDEPRTTGPVYRLGLGQPLRAEPERNLRTAQGMEHRRETERDRRSALHALRHRKVVAQGGMGRPRAPLLRLFAVQRGASAGFRPARPEDRQGVLLPPLHARNLRGPAERHGQQVATARRADEHRHRREPVGSGFRAALPDEVHQTGERHAGPGARGHGRVLSASASAGGISIRECLRYRTSALP